MKCCIVGTLTGLINGLFGAGGGMIVVPALVYYLKVDDHTAHATAISIILPLTIISSIFYINNNFVSWSMVFKTSIGGVLGGIIGAKLLGLVPSKYLRIIFGIFMIFASFRMVFFT